MLRVIIVCSLMSIIFAAKLPSNLKLCKLDDKPCMLATGQEFMEMIAVGIKELGIPPSDPFHIDRIQFHGKGGNVDLSQTYTNITLTGFATSRLSDVNISISKDNCKIDFAIHSPNRVSMKGQHKLEGKLLVFALNGFGAFEVQFVNETSYHHIPCEIVERHGVEYINATDYSFEFGIPDDLIADFENIIDGNEQFSKEINRVINENWREFFGEQKHYMEDALRATFRPFFKRLFKKFPLNELFVL